MNPKDFLYLVQADAGPIPAHIAPSDHRADIKLLTWKEPHPGALFRPSSTWTEGRNELIAYAKANDRDYKYFILADDDAVVLPSWQAFEDALLHYRPRIGVPFFPPFGHSKLYPPIQGVRSFDAIVLAFDRDTFYNLELLPYRTELDALSWYDSQALLIHLCGPRVIVEQFTSVECHNQQHRGGYPAHCNWVEMEQWAAEHGLVDVKHPKFISLTSPACLTPYRSR